MSQGEFGLVVPGSRQKAMSARPLMEGKQEGKSASDIIHSVTVGTPSPQLSSTSEKDHTVNTV